MTERDLDPLRPYSGSATREKPIYTAGPIGPWRAYVRVTPIAGLSYRNRFEISADWHGPGLAGLPPADEPVDASDVYWLPDVELALKVAKAAAEAFRAPTTPPDLRALAHALV